MNYDTFLTLFLKIGIYNKSSSKHKTQACASCNWHDNISFIYYLIFDSFILPILILHIIIKQRVGHT